MSDPGSTEGIQLLTDIITRINDLRLSNVAHALLHYRF